MRLVIIVLVMILTGCKSSSHKCDAYGSEKNYTDNLVAKK